MTGKAKTALGKADQQEVATQSKEVVVAVEDSQAVPYGEFGGLTQTMADRRQAAARKREEARKEWEQRVAEQSNARMALTNRLRPEDTSKEQRKLRNLAIGQAAGEFLGALFGGIHGLGKSGRGYVPKMPELYKNTMQRMQRLKDNDIAANQRFNGLIGSMMEQDAGGRTAIAREQYRDAATEERQMRMAEDYAEREAQRAESRRELGDIQAVQRSKLQQDRHEQRLREQRNAASLKPAAGSDSGVGGDVAYVTKLLLPKTRTSTTTNGKFPTKTVRDVTSYNKQEVAAATALAQQIVPVRSRYSLSDYDVRVLHEAIIANREAGVSWQQVADALAEGYDVDDIVLFIGTN